MTDLIHLGELEAAARAVLPAQNADYIAGGADDEITLRDNRRVFERVRLRPRYLVDVSKIDTEIELFGTALAAPVLLAPTAFQVLAHPDGETATARAAAAAGTVYCASTLSSYDLADIAAAADGPRWFQLYCAADRGITEDLVTRAKAAGYQALCLTVDVPVLGRREADLRNGFRLPEEALPRNIMRFLELDALTRSERESALDRLIGQLFDPALSWRDLAWIKSLSDLPLLIKGILTAEDARLALDHGADGIVVSNHGGRQLDGVPASLDVLAEIVEAVDGACPVLMDGGVRRGTDVVKALALGADAVSIGRPYVWGLAIGGEQGVAQVLDMLTQELRSAMALVGAASIADIVPQMIERRRRFDR